MTNVVSLHGEKRWRAVIEYDHGNGPVTIEHFFEELAQLHQIVEQGPDWNKLIRCTVTLNRADDGTSQNRMAQVKRHARRLEHCRSVR